MRLLIGVGALVALLVLFVLVVTSRDASSTTCTIPWTNLEVHAEGGDVTISYAGGGDRTARCATDYGAALPTPSERRAE